MKKIFFSEGDNYPIAKNRTVKVIKYNNGNKEIKDSTSNEINYLEGIKKISKYNYINRYTGEICDYNLNEFKNYEDLKKSMSKLEKLLFNNFNGDKNELFITLTCSEDIYSIKMILRYFKKFLYRIKKDYKDIEYVCVPEKHEERDSWHLHVLLKNPKSKRLYISNEDVENKYWKHGYTKTSRITNKKLDVNINETERIQYIKSTNINNEEFSIDKVIKYLCKTRTKIEIPYGSRCFYNSKGIKPPSYRKN